MSGGKESDTLQRASSLTGRATGVLLLQRTSLPRERSWPTRTPASPRPRHSAPASPRSGRIPRECRSAPSSLVDAAPRRLARNNLKSVPKTVSVYWGDAADYSEYENYDTFYLYNPFDRKILEKCLDLILASLKQRPRKLTVFYCNSVYGDVLKQRGFKKEGQFYYKTTVFVFDGDKMRNE